MVVNTNENTILASVGETATLVGLKETTVRKYSQLLEKHGYVIHKNEFGHRGYVDRDVLVLKKIKSTSKSTDMSLEEVIKLVVSTFVSVDMQDTDIQKVDVSHYISKEDFDQYKQEQEQFQKALLSKLDQQATFLQEQQKYITDSLEKRDRALMESLKESQDARQLKIEQHRKPWWKIWN